MSGRIRTLKPEILDDARTAELTDAQWRLFVSLILLADDHGNLHGDPRRVESAVFWASRDTREDVASMLCALASASLIVRYTVRGQLYVHLSGWSKHQRIDRPSKPRVPQPCEADSETLASDSRDCGVALATDLRSSTIDHRPSTKDQGGATAPGAVVAARKPRDERKVLFAAVLKSEAKAAGYTSTPDVSGKVRDAVLRMASEEAEAAGTEFEVALRARVSGGLSWALRSGKEAHWAIKDWRPGTGVYGRANGRLQRTLGTTHEDFPDDGTYERQMAALRGEQNG